MGNIIKSSENSMPPTREMQAPSQGYYVPQKPIDLHRLWNTLVKRKLLILLVTLAVFAAATLYSFLASPIYRSAVSLQIEPEAVRVLPYATISDSMVKAPGDFELYMKTQDELIRGPVLIERAWNQVAKKFPNINELALKGDFAAGMQVVRIQGSQIMQVFYESYDSEFSAYAANAIADEFINYHFERKVETTRKATDFLQNQLEASKNKVEKAEAELVRYAKEHNILDQGGNQENVIRQRFGLLNSQVAEAERQLIARRAAYDELKDLSLDTFPSRLRTDDVANLETQMLQTEQDLATLRLQFGENWPAVVSKRQELSLKRDQLASLKRDALTRAVRDAEIGYQSALQEYSDLTRKYREQQDLVNRLNEASIQYNTLKRDAEASDQLYQGLVQRLGETGVGAALEFGNIHKATPAKASRLPYKPRLEWNMALGLFLGLSAGVWLSLLLEYMDRSLKNPSDLESLGIPVLGWIPVIGPDAKKRNRLGSGGKSGYPINLLGEAGSSGALTTRSQAWDANTRESYRKIVASLLLSRAGSPARSIVFTSSIPKEGKTTTIENMGKTLAEIGSKTLLIDADFRNPSLTNRFGLTNGKGFSVYLAGGELNVRDTGIPNLYLIPSGPLPPNPITLLLSEIFDETIERLKKDFQYILIDSPPVLSLADPCVIASRVDGVIMVVRSDGAPKDLTSRAHRQLTDSGANVLGAVFNRVNLKNPENSYYRKYYYYHRYGTEQNDKDKRE